MEYRFHLLLSGLFTLVGCSAGSSSPDVVDPKSDSGITHDSGNDSSTFSDAPNADTSIAPDSALPDSTLVDSTADSETGLTVLTGKLVGGTGDYPGSIGGVWYKSGSLSGLTTATGEFSYEKGASIQFGVADISFRDTHGAPFISPWQLAAKGDCVGSTELDRLLVLLQSLDTDNDPSTGTHLSAPPKAPLRPLSSLSDTDITGIVEQLIPGRTLVDAQTALHRFILQMDNEIWAQKAMDTFSTADSAIRSQGVTTDGSYWYFSWRLGLTKTDLALNTVMKNTVAIPPLLAVQGSDHIGDIDYWDGKLYIPIEDSKAYKKPYIVLYDTELNAGQQFPLPSSMLTKGVPWVAIDAPRSSLYVAEWDPTPSILVFSLSNITYQRSIALTPPLGRIQGAKVFEGALYANSDNDAKAVYKINLETGTAIPLFMLNIKVECEGLAFLSRADGTSMHTTNTTLDYNAMEFRHHERTRDPLRKSVCK